MTTPPSEPGDEDAGVVIVGASVGAARTVQALRRSGFDRVITVIGDETHSFYNRPPLTKEYLAGEADLDDIWLIKPSEHEPLGIRLYGNTRALALDPKRRTLNTTRGVFRYDTAIIATGMRARRISLLDDANNVYYLRTIEDAQRLRNALHTASKIVIIGFGFLGCEIAASARQVGVDVTIVDSHLTPYGQFGSYFSERLTALHKDHGVRLELGATPMDRVIVDSRLTELTLTNGARLEADLVVAAVGAEPNIEWLEGSGLNIDSGVVCAGTLEAAPNVYAVGDVARWPHPINGHLTRIEHWTNAVDQAATVAHNIVNRSQKQHHRAVPYFWSTQYGRQIQYLGFLENHSDSQWYGANAHKIVGVFMKDQQVGGIIGIDSANIVMRSRATVASRKPWDLGLLDIKELAKKYNYENL